MPLFKHEHDHKWFVAQVKKEYESAPTDLYSMVEYAFVVCSTCGAVKKQKVEQP
jgi:hypothetical protein